jgi:hypothetical protein
MMVLNRVKYRGSIEQEGAGGKLIMCELYLIIKVSDDYW